MRNNKKMIIIVLLMFVVLGMGVGYSILSKQLKIEGNATIATNFDVAIIGVDTDAAYFGEYKCVGCAEVNSNDVEYIETNFTSTTATFDVKLQVGEIARYVVTIMNTGNIPTEVLDVLINKTGSEAIKLITPRDIDGYWLNPGEYLEYFIELSGEQLTPTDNGATNVAITFNFEQRPSDIETKNNIPFIYFGATVYNDPENQPEVPIFTEIFYSGLEDEINISSNLYVSINDAEYELYRTSHQDFYFSFDNENLIEGRNIVKLKLEHNGKYSNEIILEYYK